MHKRDLVIATDKPSCTAIVCAYNEEKTLEKVLTALLDSSPVDEVVVVDDGSGDGTPAILKRFASHKKVQALRFSENRGKGYAMAEAALSARGEILLFIDADLLNLSPDHVAQLLEPLLRGEADMVIGYLVRGQGIVEMIAPFRSLSGERAILRKDFLPLVEDIRASGYGVEMLINLHCRREGKRVRYSYLKGLTHPIKAEKFGPIEALRMYVHEALQIIQAMTHHYPLVLAAYGWEPKRTLLGDQSGD